MTAAAAALRSTLLASQQVGRRRLIDRGAIRFELNPDSAIKYQAELRFLRPTGPKIEIHFGDAARPCHELLDSAERSVVVRDAFSRLHADDPAACPSVGRRKNVILHSFSQSSLARTDDRAVSYTHLTLPTIYSV